MASLADLQAELVAYKAAALAIVSGAQSYGIAGRSLTRANIAEINKQIAVLEARVDRIGRSASGEAINTMTPVFITQRGSTS